MKKKIGKRYELEVSDNGFCLWDKKTGTWVLDASMLLQCGVKVSTEANGFKKLKNPITQNEFVFELKEKGT